MIKFFRHFRQAMIKENKVSKYLIYAIGEIVLVVIGILIAVQINDWNTNRVSKTIEIATLTQLNSDLKSNYEELTELYTDIELANANGPKILNFINDPTEPIDSLRAWVEWISASNIFNNANTTYKSLASNKSTVISNDSLRLKVTLMYENQFSNVHKREAMLNNDYLHNYKQQQLNNFKIGPVIFKWLDNKEFDVNTPKNIIELKNNEMYKNSLVELYNFRLLRLKWLSVTLKKLDDLIKEIEREILRLERN